MGHTDSNAPGGIDPKPEQTVSPLASEVSVGSNVTFEEFCALDLRVGKVETAERVPKSKKLIKMGVYFGEGLGRRIILAGIGDHPEFVIDTIINGLFVFLVNLPPRPIMGIESHGMMLAATSFDGRATPLSCSAWALPGAKVG